MDEKIHPNMPLITILLNPIYNPGQDEWKDNEGSGRQTTAAFKSSTVLITMQHHPFSIFLIDKTE